MPRPLRLEYKDAWYHVMNRGARRQDIFKNSGHKQAFLELLSDATKLFDAEIHGYCLMDNHYHLLMKTPRGNLSRIMRHINGIYTQKFNRFEKKEGPLFRGRYKAILVDCDEYLLQVSRYIHLNPVIAKIVKQGDKYQWSSYREYLKTSERSTWLHTEEVLSMVSQKKAVEKYKQFVDTGLDDETKEFYKRKAFPVIFGTKEFKKKILNQLHEHKIKASITEYKRTQELPSIEKVIESCAKYFKIEKNEFYQSVRGKENVPRNIAMYGCRYWCSEKLSSIAEKFQTNSHSAVSNIIRNVARKAKTSKELVLAMKHIQKMVLN
jgi:REP element-mobilizing transposase RayT